MQCVIFVLVVVVCSPAAARELLVDCSEDSQCHDGKYCDTTAKVCLDCLSCEDLMRKPLSTSNCIKTLGECGPCLDGLVVSHRGDLQCVPAVEADAGIPPYIWAIIIGALLIVIFLAVVIFVFKGSIFKISARTLLDQSCATPTAASAPEAPPPYNSYSLLSTDVPSTMAPRDSQPLQYVESQQEDTSLPFVKRVPSLHRPENREIEDNQNARVYNPPAYVRINRPPSPANNYKDGGNLSPVHDEETVESVWTPTSNTNSNANVTESVSDAVATRLNGNDEASSLSMSLAAARETTLVQPPPKKLKSHDSNNNGNSENVSSESSSFTASSHPHSHAPAMFLNIQVNNTIGTSVNGQL